MKKMGRVNRPFFRVVAVDSRKARDGRVLEYLGHYDPNVLDTDGRAVLNGPRIDHWLSVGAQPSDKVRVLMKKYGTNGTNLAQQKAAREKLKAPKQFVPPKPLTKQLTREEIEAARQAAAAAAAAPEETPAETAEETGESAAGEN
jgi:small subunit ribosomal protein S16